jgi:hypothetical protein
MGFMLYILTAVYLSRGWYLGRAVQWVRDLQNRKRNRSTARGLKLVGSRACGRARSSCTATHRQSIVCDAQPRRAVIPTCHACGELAVTCSTVIVPLPARRVLVGCSETPTRPCRCIPVMTTRRGSYGMHEHGGRPTTAA